MESFFYQFSQFFTWLQETVTSLVDFLISFVNDLIFVVDLTARFVTNIPSYLNWLPSECLSIIIIAFGIVVVYKILGREG